MSNAPAEVFCWIWAAIHRAGRWMLDKLRLKACQPTWALLYIRIRPRARIIHLCDRVRRRHHGSAGEQLGQTGGIDDRARFMAHKAHLLRFDPRNAMITHSQSGYGYAVEKAETTVGWTFTGFDEEWNTVSRKKCGISSMSSKAAKTPLKPVMMDLKS